MDRSIPNFPNEYARSHRFTCGAPRNFSFVGPSERKSVLFLRSSGPYETTLSLWEFDIASGEETLLVDPKNLHAEQTELSDEEKSLRERFRESASGITSYSTDTSGNWVCFSLNGSLFLFARDTKQLLHLSSNGAEKQVFDPRISPDGKKIAYTTGNDFYCAIQKDDRWETFGNTALLTSSDQAISYGRAEFIAAEEMRRTKGFWWSPQSDQLLVTEVDTTAVNTWWIANPASPVQEPNQMHYPKAGSKNAAVRLLLVDLDKKSQEILWTEDKQYNTYEYLTSVRWTDQALLITRQTRDQKQLDICTVETESDQLPFCKSQATLSDLHWVEITPSLPRLSAKGLITLEDIGGKRTLCLQREPVDTGDIILISLLSFDEDAGVLLFSGYGRTPAEMHTYSIQLESGAVSQLTKDLGVHKTIVSQNMAIVSSTSSAFPGSKIWLGELSESQDMLRPLATIKNLAATPPLKIQASFHTLTKKELGSVLLLPEDHDGAALLPVILDPYGGPHAQRVLHSHNAHTVSQWFANQGYAVIVTDGSGTPGKGPAWEKAIAGDLATPVLQDQIDALNSLAEQFDFLDLERVGIRGWSFGGYLAALAVLRRPDRFHAAIAGAPVTDWRLYDTHYTERYLGSPEMDQSNYQQCDLTHEPDLSRPLLLIHGLADDNVVAAHTLKLSSALLNKGAPHNVLPLSGVTHMTPQHTVAENLLHLQADFFRQNL